MDMFLNVLTNNIIHFCITNRFVSNKSNCSKLIECLNSCSEQITTELLTNPNMEYDASIKLYCSVDQINHPTKK